MFIGDSIGRAVEELWQLAMTMASLKHIAGMINQEVHTTTASTGLVEENKETSDSQVDKTEAVSNKCFANNEIIANEETERDALFASNSCNSVHKIETLSHPEEHLLHTWTTDLMNNTEKEDDNEFMQISMVAHQLPQHDAPQEISELPVSMAAHVIATNDEEDRMEQYENISMIDHQIADQYTNVKAVIHDEEPIEETGNCFIPSMCTHEISYLDTSAESSEHQVSMVAHYQQTFDKSGIEHEDDALSMVCHQTSEHYNVQECQLDLQDQEQELVDDGEVDRDETLTFISSMVSHQLSDIDTLLEISEIPVSMATHVIATNDMEDTIDTSQTISMIAHQILNEEKSNAHVAFSIIDIAREETDALDQEQILMEDAYFISSVCTLGISKTETQLETTKYEFKEDEEEQKIQSIDIEDLELGENKAMEEPTFISSTVPHQLAPLDNVLELSEISLTMAAHVIITDRENSLDTKHDISMIVHQIMNHDIDMEQTVSKSSDSIQMMNTVENVFIPSMCTHEISYLDTPAESLECEVLMVAHYQHIAEDRFEHEEDVLSIINHQVTIDDTVSSKELQRDEEVVLIAASAFLTSMVAHQLPTLDTLLEFSNMPASMAAHFININDMAEGETQQNISMVVHQIINEDKSVYQDTNVFITIPEDDITDTDIACANY